MIIQDKVHPIQFLEHKLSKSATYIRRHPRLKEFFPSKNGSYITFLIDYQIPMSKIYQVVPSTLNFLERLTLRTYFQYYLFDSQTGGLLYDVFSLYLLHFPNVYLIKLQQQIPILGTWGYSKSYKLDYRYHLFNIKKNISHKSKW